ncbi:hypothetical protein QJS10_CPA08g01088 [Acorus calamus]|uniref:Hpc2-related domain-containing protein n=1 Tax=Acorus calamus TaxID=4465 RepID=A0AAV9EC14_ACOCL|nr:hypothetical protein QJS10_CPA08g01088 [Acorus calamus]
MEGESSLARATPPPSAVPPQPFSSQPPSPPASAAAMASTSSSVSGGGRQRFSLELRPGETTIVSWKKLLKDSGKLAAAAPSVAPSGPPPAGAHPALESRISPPQSQTPVVEANDAPPSNRFSAVIEKIERLYTGNSDEEELDDIPDDDQYDTEDSFIDDTELDEYFEVEKTSTKHNGFFVNKGKLEHIDPESSTDHPVRKRRRKDSSKTRQEREGGEHVQNKLVNLGDVKIKAAARNASLVTTKSSSSSKLLSKVITPLVNHYEDGKYLKNFSCASAGHSKMFSEFEKHDNSQSFKMQNKDTSQLPIEAKDVEKQKSTVFQSWDSSSRLNVASEFDSMQQAYHGKVVPTHLDCQSRKATIDSKEMMASAKYTLGKNGSFESPDMSTSGSTYHSQILKSSSALSKEILAVRPKGTTFERAIRDLERIVAESRPPNLDVQETDASSQGVKRRLPQDVKLKLAKVARLASSQGKISEGLIDQLMGILGHLVQRKTLKRNLKEMIQLGLSAKQHKDDRFQQIKKEVTEMIRATVPSLTSKVARQQDSSSVDFQQFNANDEKIKEKYRMDSAMENKICDLYDLYVEGMDEDKGPQIRKLYVELAELWPNGYMDNHGIKGAVYRAKERKRALLSPHKVLDEERLKGRTANMSSQLNRTATDQATYTSTDKLIGNQTLTASAMTSSSFSSLNGTSSHHRPVVLQDAVRADVHLMKKNSKRKTESDMGEIHGHQATVLLERQKKQHKSEAVVASSCPGQPAKPSLQSPGHQVVGNIADV